MLMEQLSHDIKAFILSNNMLDVELNDAGCEEHGDFFAFFDFNSQETFEQNREKLILFLQNEIIKQYGDFIDASFTVDFGIVDGAIVSINQFNNVIDALEPIFVSPCYENKPPITKEIINFLEKQCQDTFRLNEEDYGDEFINIVIQVDSYNNFLNYEEEFYSFLSRSINKHKYRYAQICIIVGVLMVNGELVNESLYSREINRLVYGIE